MDFFSYCNIVFNRNFRVVGLQIEFCVKIIVSIYEGMIQLKNAENYVRDFRQYLIEEEKSPVTIDKYMRDILSFIVWCNDRELTKKLLLEYKQNLIDKYAPSSVNSIISSINSFLKYNGWYSLKVKTLKIQKQMFACKDKELTKIEYERFLSEAKRKNNQRLYYLMQTI